MISAGTNAALSLPRNKVDFVAVFAVAICARLAFMAFVTPTPFFSVPDELVDMDMYAFREWAASILSGDWKGANTYHPSFSWMTEIGTAEEWGRWWGGDKIFHQAPAYPYLLALLTAITNAPWQVAALQLLIGALYPLIVLDLCSRLYGRRVGVIAGVMAAVHGPLMLNQALPLRDWLHALFEAASFLAAVFLIAKKRHIDAIILGLALALAVMTKSSSLILILPCLVLCFLSRRENLRGSIIPVVFCGLTLMVALSPVIIRNLAVDAPPLSLSNRLAEGLIEGNAIDGFPYGMIIPDSMETLLKESDGNVLQLINSLSKPYLEEPARIYSRLLVKVRAILDPYEAPNNINYYFVREIAPSLWLYVPFGFLLVLAMPGIYFSRRHRTGFWLLGSYAVMAILPMLLTIVISRYRLPLLLPLFIWSALTLDVTVKAITQNEYKKIVAIALAVVLATVLIFRVAPLEQMRKYEGFMLRPAEYIVFANDYAQQGQWERGSQLIQDLIDRATDLGYTDMVFKMTLWRGGYLLNGALSAVSSGQHGLAERLFQQGQNSYGRYVTTERRYYSAKYFSVTGEAEKATNEFEQFLLLESDGVRAEEARNWVQQYESDER